MRGALHARQRLPLNVLHLEHSVRWLGRLLYGCGAGTRCLAALDLQEPPPPQQQHMRQHMQQQLHAVNIGVRMHIYKL